MCHMCQSGARDCWVVFTFILSSPVLSHAVLLFLTLSNLFLGSLSCKTSYIPNDSASSVLCLRVLYVLFVRDMINLHILLCHAFKSKSVKLTIYIFIKLIGSWWHICTGLIFILAQSTTLYGFWGIWVSAVFINISWVYPDLQIRWEKLRCLIQIF